MIIDEILEKRKNIQILSCKEFIEKENEKGIIIYGAGAFGRETFELLKKYGVSPIVFLDKNAREGQMIGKVAVVKPDSVDIKTEVKEEAKVYIAITMPGAKMATIIDYVHSIGFKNVFPVQTLMGHKIVFDDTEIENPGDDYIKSVGEKIEQVYDLMADDESRETFISCVQAHLLRNYEKCIETPSLEQYFDAGVTLKKGMKNFVDCGAYNGDSLRTILNYKDKLENYIAFEPIASNISGLSETVDRYKDRLEQAVIYTCGLSSTTGVAFFSDDASASTIVKEGEGNALPIVKMDDVLVKMKVDFIKMDIEGAEVEALKGAERIIRELQPDLAISTYHKVNHYWDIPLMIYEMNPEYKFYLRTHTPGTLESVLYCTME